MALAAAIQMVSGAELGRNFEQAAGLLREAAQAGARMAVLPENFALMGVGDSAKLAVTEPAGAGPVTFHGFADLNRAGEFTMRVTATDRVTGQSTTFETPIRVTDP